MTGLERLEAEEDNAALREALAAAQVTAAAVQGEVEEECCATACSTSESMAICYACIEERPMSRCCSASFTDEKMALNAAKIAHIRTRIARRMRHLTHVCSRH